MPEAELNPSYQLTDVDKTAIVAQLKQSLIEDGTPLGVTESDKLAIASQISSDISSGSISVAISDSDKADIIQEVLAELYANSQDTAALEKVASLDGIASIPAVKDDSDIVSVPLGLLTTSKPIEISGQDDIDILVAQGKIVPTQIYFVPVDNE